MRRQLILPFGRVELFFDGKPVWFDVREIEDLPENESNCTVYAIDYDYDYFDDGREHTLECKFVASLPTTYNDIESGEMLETFTYDLIDKIRVHVGCMAAFGYYKEYNLDFDGDYDRDVGDKYFNAIVLKILPETKSQRFTFGIAYALIDKIKNNEVETWLAVEEAWKENNKER
ncbi:hypothetical protein [uncultured Eubacterium sp.]|uniref:hypothetical protein n=1 Tax=uncultured Eubacterium sp. TaxID=165185 RepID=UPI0025963BA8|nr:hypothetical protein [uncultured Eubacterium sp.]